MCATLCMYVGLYTSLFGIKKQEEHCRNRSTQNSRSERITAVGNVIPLTAARMCGAGFV